jgi:hypothetical protein
MSCDHLGPALEHIEDLGQLGVALVRVTKNRFAAPPRSQVPCFFAFTINARSFVSSRRVVHFAWIALPAWQAPP